MRVLVQRGSGPGTLRGDALWAVGKVGLDADEVHHLRVRRARDHEAVEILDGAGLRGTGRLLKDGKRWLVEIQSINREERPAELTLAVAAGDRERFSWMVEKAAELGVTDIVPLETTRTGGVATRFKNTHVPRLRRSALEAIKQCGATWAPRIEDPVTLEEFIGRSRNGTRWLADPAGEPAPPLIDQNPLAVVIGPEGGLTDDERHALLAAGYLPVALGRHTLRFETAALAAAAAVVQARMRRSHG
jgi:16S rRNA (uracil1498-N3)-methyltransferase